jgi:hypothetical protein
MILTNVNMHAGCLKAMLSGEKGSRSKSGATAITVFCQADAKAIGRMPEKAQLHKKVQAISQETCPA